MPPLHQRTRLTAYIARDVRSYSFAELERASSKQAIRSAVLHGEIVRMFTGIYVAREHQDSFAARAHAALRWAGPKAALAGESALFLWGGVADAPTRIHIVLPHGSGRRTPSWARLTHAAYAYPTAMWQSFMVVTAEVALIQAYRYLPSRAIHSVVYGCIARGIVHPVTLAEALTYVPRIRNRSGLETIVKAALLGAESYLEQVGADEVFACAELEGMLRQHRIRVGVDRFRCDFCDALGRTAIELDGAAYHRDLEARERDISRDTVLASVGVQSIRFSYRDITERQQWCLEMLIAIVRERRQAALARN